MIKLLETDFNPWQEIEKYAETKSAAFDGKLGASNIFIGTMRDFNDGDEVTAMTLEHYPPMTETKLADLVEAVMQQWAVLDVLLIHRVGKVFPNQTIVLIVVWACHRGQAFNACRAIIDSLKSKVPFWKKEQLVTGKSRWVTTNTTDEH
jgi:molybdopterin synthase catalytic subunit